MSKLSFPVVLLLAVLIAGCNTYRFMPSHGGGKRFDEEERAVSAAIRNAVAQLELGQLSGHKTNVVVTTLAHNGGATVAFPGVANVSASYSYNSQNYYTAPVVLNDQDSWSASASYNPNLNAVPTVFGTDQDMAYLEASIQMKLRVAGAAVAVPDPEYVLYVLIDVLGTNRSKQDSFVVWRDMLTASCELTYYIVDTKTNKTVSAAKRASAEASYGESSIFGLAGYRAERTQYKTQPNPMPTDVNDRVIVAYKAAKAFTGQKANKTALWYDDTLAIELQEAQDYLDAGNLEAAEKLILKIRAVNPNYPGLAPLASRLQNAKARLAAPASQSKPAPAPAPVPKPAPAQALAPEPKPATAPEPNPAPAAELKPAPEPVTTPVPSSAPDSNSAPAPTAPAEPKPAPAPAPEPNQATAPLPTAPAETKPTPAPSPAPESAPASEPTATTEPKPAPAPAPEPAPAPAPAAEPAPAPAPSSRLSAPVLDTVSTAVLMDEKHASLRQLIFGPFAERT